MPEAFSHVTTRQVTKYRNQQLRHEMHVWNHCLRVQQYIMPYDHTEMKRRSGHKGSRTGTAHYYIYIDREYSVDWRNRKPWAQVSLHIRKPKPLTRVEDGWNRTHKPCEYFTISHQKIMWVGSRVPSPKHITLPWIRDPYNVVLAGDEKNSLLSHILRGEDWIECRHPRKDVVCFYFFKQKIIRL